MVLYQKNRLHIEDVNLIAEKKRINDKLVGSQRELNLELPIDNVSPEELHRQTSSKQIPEQLSNTLKSNKCYLFNMNFGIAKKKSFLIYFDKNYTNIELLYEDTNQLIKGKMIYKTPKSKKKLENFENSVPNERIPTSIPIEEEGWYLLTVSFRGHGPSFKNTMVTVKATNTETKKTNKIRFEVARVSFLTDTANYHFFSNFYGVVTSIIKTNGNFQLKNKNGQDRLFLNKELSAIKQ